MQSETCRAEEANQACSLAQARNGELIKKLDDTEKKVDQLQDVVQRSILKMKHFRLEDLGALTLNIKFFFNLSIVLLMFHFYASQYST